MSSLDDRVARRIRARREVLNLAQRDLAQAIGVTTQQLHRYENGITRISASRLFAIAKALGVPIGHFFEDLQVAAAEEEEHSGAPSRALPPLDLSRNVDLATLLSHFMELSPGQKHAVLDMIRSMAEAAPGTEDAGRSAGP